MRNSEFSARGGDRVAWKTLPTLGRGTSEVPGILSGSATKEGRVEIGSALPNIGHGRGRVIAMPQLSVIGSSVTSKHTPRSARCSMTKSKQTWSRPTSSGGDRPGSEYRPAASTRTIAVQV